MRKDKRRSRGLSSYPKDISEAAHEIYPLVRKRCVTVVIQVRAISNPRHFTYRFLLYQYGKYVFLIYYIDG